MNDKVQRVKRYIEQNFDSIQRIQSIGREFNIPYEQLRKAFAREVGVSMQQYLEGVRVNAARWKISEGKKLYAVAREVGYTYESTLIKHFKKITGMTPKQYRELFNDDEEEVEP